MSQWKRIRLKNTISSSKNGVWGNDPDGENDVMVIRVADFNRDSLKVNKAPTLRAILERDLQDRTVNFGDLIIEKSGGGDKQPVGTVVSSNIEEPCTCSNFLAILSPKPDFNNRYLVYLHSSVYNGGKLLSAIKQTTGIQNLDLEAYLNFKVSVPPFETQIKIAKYLDRKTAELGQLVGAKQQLLKLLDEKKRALIARAVTRGLDPAVPLKESGIPWLGRIPTHWEIERSRWLFTQSDLPVREDDEMVTCFRDGMVTLRSNRREAGFTNAILELGYQGVRKGQLVIHSMDAFAGAIGVSDSDGKCTPEYVICDPVTDKTDSDYYGVLLREMALQHFIQSQCSAVRERAPRIRFTQFKDFELPVPHIEEQKLIVAHIKQASQSIKQLQEVTEKAISLLKERRTALISAAVTGNLCDEILNAGIRSQTKEPLPNQAGEHHPCLI